MMKFIVLLFVLSCVCAEMPGIWLEDIDFTQRIVKGHDAQEGEFPYMISFQRKNDKRHICGGSILTRNWVLTAAHCCVAVRPTTHSIYAGSIYFNKGGIHHTIEEIIIHEKYDANQRWRNDICLIRLSSPLTYNNNIQQITLPHQDWPVNSGDRLTVSGWGYTTPNVDQQTTPNRMQKSNAYSALSNEHCGTETQINMFPGYLCARGGEKGQGVCNGDSGSPIVKNRVQVGIASWVFRPCGSGKPDFFCRVPNYIEWIKQKLGRDVNELKFIN